MKKIKIGILGGIGPEATSEFYYKFISKLQEDGLIKSNKDFPQIIINSIPAPELIYDDISDEDIEPYIMGVKELDRFNVDFIVMVCNTIHIYHERLQKETQIPILNLREELKNLLQKNNIKSTLILGTPLLIKKGLYRYKGIKPFEPNENEIKRFTDLIFNFNRGVNKELQIGKLKEICEKHMNDGAETIILGCTELSLMLENEHLPSIDTVDLLVNSTLEKFKKMKASL
jgi:aspartate racemase